MSSDGPLYERDRQAWTERLAEGNRTQARKRVGADVLIRDGGGRVLLVNPTYKPDWDLPGGMAEANEPPHVAAVRELHEELSLEIRIRRLLCIDWVSPHGPWDDSLMFIFEGESLSDRQTGLLRPIGTEVAEVQFCSVEVAQRLLRPYVWRRVRHAIAALEMGGFAYLADGYPVT